MSKNAMIAIIAAVVLAGAGVGAYVFMKKDDGGTQTSDSSKTADNDAARKFGDACTVFTKEAIGAALGGTYGEGEEGIGVSMGTPGSDNYEELRGSECSFDQENDGSTAGMTAALDFTIAVNNHESASAAKTFMDDLHSPQTAEGQEAMGTPTDVDGVGDKAFFPRVNTLSSVYEKTEALYVQVGKQVVVLTATRLDGVDRDAVRTALTSLAQDL